MKKKIRIRKRSSSEEQAKGEEESVPGRVSLEKEEREEEAVPSAVSSPQAGKLEVIGGFGIMGLVVGFLAGYGNMDMSLGIMDGLAGLAAGMGLGYLPYMSFKK